METSPTVVRILLTMIYTALAVTGIAIFAFEAVGMPNLSVRLILNVNPLILIAGVYLLEVLSVEVFGWVSLYGWKRRHYHEHHLGFAVALLFGELWALFDMPMFEDLLQQSQCYRMMIASVSVTSFNEAYQAMLTFLVDPETPSKIRERKQLTIFSCFQCIIICPLCEWVFLFMTLLPKIIETMGWQLIVGAVFWLLTPFAQFFVQGRYIYLNWVRL